MQVFPGITPWNVYDIEFDLLAELIQHARRAAASSGADD